MAPHNNRYTVPEFYELGMFQQSVSNYSVSSLGVSPSLFMLGSPKVSGCQRQNWVHFQLGQIDKRRYSRPRFHEVRMIEGPSGVNYSSPSSDLPLDKAGFYGSHVPACRRERVVCASFKHPPGITAPASVTSTRAASTLRRASKGKDLSPWALLYERIGANSKGLDEPPTQVRVGLLNL